MKKERDEIKKRFGEELTEWMAKRKKKQIDVALWMDINPVRVNRWVQGERLPTLEEVQMLEDYLELEGQLAEAAGYVYDRPRALRDATIRDALGKHYDELTDVASDWASRIMFPPADLLRVVDSQGTLAIERVWFDGVPYAGFPADVVLEGRVDLEDTEIFALLREHLKSHSILALYEEWKTKIASLKQGCRDLQMQVRAKCDQGIDTALDELATQDSEVSRQVTELRCLDRFLRQWGPFVRTLKGLDVSQYFNVSTCVPMSATDECLIVGFSDPSHRNMMDNPNNKRVIEGKIADFFRVHLRLVCIGLLEPFLSRRRSVGIDRERFVSTVYQRAFVLHAAKYRQPAYRIEHDDCVRLSRLTIPGSSGESHELACLPEEAVRRLQATHESLVHQYYNCKEAKRITLTEAEIVNLGGKLNKFLRVLINRHRPPGTCEVCQSFLDKEWA